MKEHTKGPWLADTSHNTEREGITIWSNNDPNITVIIADVVVDQHEEMEANARLIAAAPDMFAALEYVANWHRQNDSGSGELFGLDYVTACLSALRRANPEWRTTRAEEVHP